MEVIGKILPYIQIIISILLIAVVLIQQRGSGAGGAFGGGGAISYKKRGIEKTLSQVTVVLAILFALTAFVRILL
jgi:preprotein translocase subunit SecG